MGAVAELGFFGETTWVHLNAEKGGLTDFALLAVYPKCETENF